MDRAKALTEVFLSHLSNTEDEMPNFIQAVREVAEDVLTIEKNDPDWSAARVLHRLAEPDRVITFRVTWADDDGNVQVNRG
ncbi:MAG: NADP-specific glutamate dehydrogenase, partial [Pseudomonadota bacterium]